MKTYTYTVYHILGIKIGCTTDFTKRMKDQGFTNWEILWQQEGDYEFGWIAGNKEIELQKQYGLPVDTTHYQISRQNRPNGVPLFASKKGGRKAKESGQLLAAASTAGKWAHESGVLAIRRAKSNEKIECVYCTRMIDRKNHARWHGDKCKKRYEN